METATDTGGRELTQSGVLDATIGRGASASVNTRSARKERCEDCFFHQNLLCALEDKKPCPTFRPAHPEGLRPPRQLSFVFRQGRRQDPFQYEPQPS
jgi:hypothetical protein